MDTPAQKIHEALHLVSQLRHQHASEPPLAQAVIQIKRFQARRFQASYSDLLHSPRYKTATAFFLHELYSDKDYAERDQQFARIASTIATLFPQAVVNTAAALAEVHALTETLDDLMAQAWLEDLLAAPRSKESARYIRCWRKLGNLAARYRQLEVVLHLGHELDLLTHTRGLRTLLRMMRRPAAAAGLRTLQYFLETGFDAFVKMKGADEFLKVVSQRETEWIQSLFDDNAAACETRLAHLLESGTADQDKSAVKSTARVS